MFNLFSSCLPSATYIQNNKKELCSAIINNNLEKVKFLLSIHTPVDFLASPKMRHNIPSEDWGYIPLTHFAAILATNDTRILEEIIKAGGNVKQVYEIPAHPTSGSILHNTLNFHNYAPTLNILISSGANVDSKNNNGYAVLHLAAKSSAQATQIMLENHANINVLDNDMNSVMHYAKDQFVFQILNNYHAKVDLPNKSGITPLMRAVQSGKLMLISKLINAGASLTAKDHNGKDIIDYASENNLTLTFIDGKIALLSITPQHLRMSPA